MAFKLTYTDGQEAEYDDDTAWEVDHGVLKMGRTDDWTVLVSPSHWAVIEVGSAKKRAESDAESKDDESGEDESGDDGDGDGDGHDSDSDNDNDNDN
jgi:hypothetical protein